MKWKVKRNQDGQVIPRCWISDSGYTVAECRLPHARYPITRPGATQPFAYAKDRREVIALITQDSTAAAE